MLIPMFSLSQSRLLHLSLTRKVTSPYCWYTEDAVTRLPITENLPCGFWSCYTLSGQFGLANKWLNGSHLEVKSSKKDTPGRFCETFNFQSISDWTTCPDSSHKTFTVSLSNPQPGKLSTSLHWCVFVCKCWLLQHESRQPYWEKDRSGSAEETRDLPGMFVRSEGRLWSRCLIRSVSPLLLSLLPWKKNTAFSFFLFEHQLLISELHFAF